MAVDPDSVTAIYASRLKSAAIAALLASIFFGIGSEAFQISLEAFQHGFQMVSIFDLIWLAISILILVFIGIYIIAIGPNLIRAILSSQPLLILTPEHVTIQSGKALRQTITIPWRSIRGIRGDQALNEMERSLSFPIFVTLECDGTAATANQSRSVILNRNRRASNLQADNTISVPILHATGGAYEAIEALRSYHKAHGATDWVRPTPSGRRPRPLAVATSSQSSMRYSAPASQASYFPVPSQVVWHFFELVFVYLFAGVLLLVIIGTTALYAAGIFFTVRLILEGNYTYQRLMRGDASLEITAHGLRDNASLTSLGFVKWDQVKAIAQRRVFFGWAIYISVTDDFVPSPSQNMLGRVMFAIKTSFNQPQIRIPRGYVDGSLDDIQDVLRAFHTRYG